MGKIASKAGEVLDVDRKQDVHLRVPDSQEIVLTACDEDDHILKQLCNFEAVYHAFVRFFFDLDVLPADQKRNIALGIACYDIGLNTVPIAVVNVR